jgi:hypothetical integral membrane protein (TIGR02206 family)
MFFSDEVGNIVFEEFGIWHIIPLLVILSGVLLIYIFRKKLKNYKHEKWIRYSMASFAIVMEVSLHLWKILNGTWSFPDSMPIGLCAFSLFMSIYVLFTKSWKVFEVAYFWSLGGLVSVMFPDILYGPDRFRYYQFLLAHMIFFWSFMYMMFVHNYVPTNHSFKKSFTILLGLILLVIVPINLWWNANYMYLHYPGDTPFSIFPTEPYTLYLFLCILLGMIVITVWYSPIFLYHKITKK